MVREVITVSVGQCGIQLGNRVWLQYCAEHEVDNCGKSSNSDENHIGCFFEEASSGQYVPRDLSVDLEPNCIDDMKNGLYANIFNPDFMLSGKEDAANNFARGHYTVGRDMLTKVDEKLRKQVEKCKHLQGFIINHSVGGGTGSGLGSLILENMGNNYKNKSRIGYDIYPSPNISNTIVEPYNSLMASHYLIENMEVSTVIDNEALYDITKKNLKIKNPSYEHINKLIAKVISSMTASIRFVGDLNVDMTEFQTNLVPFPRIHFMLCSYSPISTPEMKKTMEVTAKSITSTCFDYKNFFVKIKDFDIEEDKYMTTFLNYRGNVTSENANESIKFLTYKEKVKFLDWCPTPYKVGMCPKVCQNVFDDEIAQFDKSLTMIGNNSVINRVFSERVCNKFDLLYSQRAYVHWFVGEGMEEGEFAEARENLSQLSNDYQQLNEDIESTEEK